MSNSQTGGQGQGVGSPISDEAYNVITALQTKLEGLEAYKKYQSSSTRRQIWQQLSALDNQAVQILSQELERLVQQGHLSTGGQGQAAGGGSGGGSSSSSGSSSTGSGTGSSAAYNPPPEQAENPTPLHSPD